MIKRLGDLADLRRGLTYSKGDEVPFSSKRVLRSNNIDLESSSLDLTELKYLKEDFDIPEDRKVKKNSIFICMSNGSKQHVGKVAFIEDELDYAFGGFMGLIVPGANVVPKYVFYSCRSSVYRLFLSSIGNGIGITNLRFPDLANYSIPVPSIQEQEKIVAELDCLSDVIAKKKQQREELDKLARSVFYEMFGDPVTNEKGWGTCLFKDGVVEMFLGPFGSSLKTDCYVEKERSYCMVYEQKHAIKKTVELDNHFIDEEKYNSLRRFEVRPGDLIMSCRGTIGEIYELPRSAPLGIIHPSLMKIRLKDDVFDRTFLKTILDKIVKGEETNGGCVQMAITAKALGNKAVIHPPFSLQNEFAQKIESIEKQKALIKQSITETETLFNSRMDYWFNN